MSGIRMFQSGQRVQFPAQGMGTIERASDEEVVVQLGAPSSFGERKMLRTLEDNAVAPIAEALGIPRDELTAAVHARSR